MTIKVTRLKGGVKIRLNNSEFADLKSLLDHGVMSAIMPDGNAAESTLPGAKKALDHKAIATRIAGGNILRVDEDKTKISPLAPTPAPLPA